MDPSQNINNILKEAQKIQQRMHDAQLELSNLTVEGEAGGGMVKITMKGNQEVAKVHISPSLMNEDAEMLEDLIAAAYNSAHRKVEEVSKKKISDITSGIQIPKGEQEN